MRECLEDMVLTMAPVHRWTIVAMAPEEEGAEAPEVVAVFVQDLLIWQEVATEIQCSLVALPAVLKTSMHHLHRLKAVTAEAMEVHLDEGVMVLCRMQVPTIHLVAEWECLLVVVADAVLLIVILVVVRLPWVEVVGVVDIQVAQQGFPQVVMAECRSKIKILRHRIQWDLVSGPNHIARIRPVDPRITMAAAQLVILLVRSSLIEVGTGFPVLLDHRLMDRKLSHLNQPVVLVDLTNVVAIQEVAHPDTLRILIPTHRIHTLLVATLVQMLTLAGDQVHGVKTVQAHEVLELHRAVPEDSLLLGMTNL